MATDPPVSEQTYRYFVQEATELLQVMADELQTLRQAFSLQKVHTLMRAAHTLKGASASVGLEIVQKTTHSLEDIFKALCHEDTVITQEIERHIFEGYDCLQLLISAQLAGANIDGDDILNRMAEVVSQLQQLLGDRFDQAGHLPTSSELGFDMTQSIFQLGVAQRLEALEAALVDPAPAALRELLLTQSEVFMGLGESLYLPGFEEIARMTHYALEQYPDLVLHIAPVALADLKAAQTEVLQGDRTQGGLPSVALQQFCGPDYQPITRDRSRADTATAQSTAAGNTPVSPQPAAKRQDSWLKRPWRLLTQPIGRLAHSPPISSPLEESVQARNNEEGVLDQQNSLLAEETSEENRNSEKTTDQNGNGHYAQNGSAPLREPATVAQEAGETAAKTDDKPDALTLSDLTPSALKALNIQPQKTEPILDPTGEGPPQLDRNLLPVEETSGESISSSETARKKQGSSGATIRMSLEHLDSLNQAMGELLTQQNRQTLYNEQLSALVKKLLNRISNQQQQLHRQQLEYLTRRRFPFEVAPASVGAPAMSVPDPSPTSPSPTSPSLAYANFDPLELEQYSEAQLLVQACLEETVQLSESAEAIELFVKQSEQALEKQKRLLANTRETLLEARMVPLATVFEQFPSAVERLKLQYRKPVEVVLEGSDILVDKAVADNLYEPLVHLVRNAFDHGIEAPDMRLAQGKSFAGNITIKGTQQGRYLLVSVSDDGSGLDLAAISRQAIAQQLVTPVEAETSTPEQTIDLLFEPGFSTADATAALSGRGMGLEVVRAKMRSLQGSVTVSHQPGKGTCFTLQIPVSITIAKLLLCQSQGRGYALIADAIEHILIPTNQQVRTWKGGKMLTWQTDKEEHQVPVNALDEVLHYASSLSEHRQSAQRKQASGENSNPVILLHHQGALVGLEVEQLIGEQEMVISPLGNTLTPPAYLYGSSILPDGQLTLVLDGLMLAKIISQQRHQYLNSAAKQASTPITPKNRPLFARQLVLIIDDSITVRNTLSEALQKANYQVIQARDGTEALSLLERYPDVQAILCDIEMPGMNGFEFLKARQRQPEIAAIPTIMLTSRTGTKHRLLTEELGATSYLTKPYLTPQMLSAVAQSIEGMAGDTHE